MRLRISLLTSAALLLAAGCSIPLKDIQVSKQNVCSADADCPEGSRCALVGDASLCVSEAADLPAVILEVRPLLGDATTPSTLLGPVDLSTKAGAGPLLDLDLSIPSYVAVAPGQVYLPCVADQAVPAKVTFYPAPGVTGLLADQAYEADSMVDEGGTGQFAVSVPPGRYDIYIEPQPDPKSTPDCVGSPPVFIPSLQIAKDVGFQVHASAPIYLTGNLKLSKEEDFTQWALEVIEPIGGRIISETVTPEQTGIALTAPFKLKFDWTARDAYTPLIRLRPPEGSGKPTIVWNLEGVALAGQMGDQIPVALDVSGVDTQPREIKGTVLHEGQPVSATVTIHGKKIPGSDLNRFETVVETDSQGRFEALAPRGEYIVIARPHSELFAIGAATWDTLEGDGCFCGNSVNVPSVTTLVGSVTAPDGQPTEASIRLTPMATEVQSILGNGSYDKIPPRPASGQTTGGAFSIPVDAGTFDLSIIPPEDSGYPWLVRPRQEVTPPTNSAAPVTSLSPFALSPPAILTGTALGADGKPLPGATIRAWIGVTDPNASGAVASAVQIASTVSSADGRYVLLLPPSIKQGM
ncbi:MAG: hypothetical protein U0441_08220 [Polyangiaceae bacterium]